MKKLVILILLFSVVIISCSKDDKKSGSDEKTAVEKNSGNPDSIANQIGVVYEDGFVKLAEITKGNPEASKIKDAVKKLKEETILKMVEIGKKRELLTDLEKKEINSKLWKSMRKLGSSAHYKSMMAAHKFYMKKDMGVANDIAAFNIITQYASFELIKKQNPVEAKRLGIK